MKNLLITAGLTAIFCLGYLYGNQAAKQEVKSNYYSFAQFPGDIDAKIGDTLIISDRSMAENADTFFFKTIN